MGQKVNPNGMRLGINKTWSSWWYAKKNYVKLLHEDFKIEKYIKNKLASASISKLVIERAAKKLRLTIEDAKKKLNAKSGSLRESMNDVFSE